MSVLSLKEFFPEFPEPKGSFFIIFLFHSFNDILIFTASSIVRGNQSFSLDQVVFKFNYTGAEEGRRESYIYYSS